MYKNYITYGTNFFICCLIPRPLKVVVFTCSASTVGTPEKSVKYINNNKDTIRRQWRSSSDFIVNFEHISRSVLVFELLTLNK